MVVGRLLSYWEGDFSGAMLNFGGETFLCSMQKLFAQPLRNPNNIPSYYTLQSGSIIDFWTWIHGIFVNLPIPVRSLRSIAHIQSSLLYTKSNDQKLHQLTNEISDDIMMTSTPQYFLARVPLFARQKIICRVTGVAHRWEMNNPGSRAKYAEAQPEICISRDRIFDSFSFWLNKWNLKTQHHHPSSIHLLFLKGYKNGVFWKTLFWRVIFSHD